MTATAALSAEFIINTFDNVYSDENDYNLCVDAVKNYLEISEPCRYDYSERGYTYTDYFICNLKFNKQLEYYSEEWHNAAELVKMLPDYPVARYIILSHLVGVNNSTIQEYNPDFCLIRYSLTYGDTY